MTQGAIGKGRLWLALAPPMLAFATAVLIFARAQNIWIDETTQLSGATLTPGPLIAWLTGSLKLDFGVPPDRMPPVSYFLDMLGWRLWGDNPLAFRLYHAVLAGAGLIALLLAVGRRFGARAALIAGLILAFSPKLIEAAVEIRAYPVFFALSCAQAAMLIRGGIAARPGRLAVFLLLGLLSGYTHFFAVVATSAYVAGVFIDARSIREAVRVVIGYALLLLLWAGLVPFIFGAASISSANQVAGTGANDIASFLLQLLATGAVMVNPLTAILYFGGVGLLVLLGTIGLGRRVTRSGLAARHDPAIALAVALLAGIAVTLIAAVLVKGFNALSPRYNIWMLPPVAVLIALAADGLIAPSGKIARIVRLGGLALLAAGALWTQIGFLARADWFIHGPSRALEGLVAQSRGPTAVLHVGNGWAWGYFPLYRDHRDALPQWLLAPDGQSVIRITRGGDASGPTQPIAALDGYATLLVARIDLLGYGDLRTIETRQTPPVAPPDLAFILGERNWQGGEAVYRPGNYAFTARRYERPSIARHPGPNPADRHE